MEEQERQLLAEKDDALLQQRNLRSDIDDNDRAFRSLQNQIDANDILVKKAQDQAQAKREQVQNFERAAEDQKKKQAAANDALTRENQKASGITKQLDELRKKLLAENSSLKALDIENARLTDTVTLATGEIASLEADLGNTKTLIADAQSKLKDATDKAPLEDRIKELRTKESDLNTSIKNQKDSLAKDKAARAAIIGKKSESKLRLLEIENQLTLKTDEQTASQQAIGAAAKDEQAARESAASLARSVDKSQNELATAKGEADRLLSVQDKLDERWQDLDGHQDLLAKKGPFLSAVLISVNASLRIAQDEALPKVRSALADSKAALDDLNTDRQRLLSDSRKWQREKTDALSVLQEFQRQSGLRNAELRAAERVLGDTRVSLSSSRQTLAAIYSEVASLKNSITEREALIAKNQVSLKTIADEAAKLDAQVVAQTKVFNDAQAVEKLARDVWEPLEQNAVAAAKAIEQAKPVLAARVAAYQKALAEVVQKANRDAQDPGITEGLAGEGPGAAAGLLAGEKSWQQEGSAQLRATEFSNAFVVARASAVVSNTQAGARETTDQQAERSTNPSLQTAFEAGAKRGKGDGISAGVLLGDNAETQKSGDTAGYAAGKLRVENEMEQALRKPSYREREAEILRDDPPVIAPTKEKRDATKEVTALNHERTLSAQLASYFAPLWKEAIAADGLGVLSPSQVPKVTFSRRDYQDGALKPYHSDFPGAYRVAYDEAYERAYIASYLESYRVKFVRAHGEAFSAAKLKSAQAGFPDEVKKGTQAGAKEGLFEALGYNSGRDTGLVEGRKKGEATAYERGRLEGDSRGYKDNQEPARLASIQNGRADCDSDYRTSVRMAVKPQSWVLVEGTADKRLELNEKLSWTATLRNFGGTRAEKGTVTLQIDPASIRGIKFDRTTVPLGAIEANSEVEFSNLITGTVTANSQVSFSAAVYFQSAKVGEFTFKQDIYAPFSVAFSDYYNPAKSMKVGDVGRGNGFLNAIRVKSLGDPKLVEDLKVAITLVDATIGKTSWHQATGEFVALDEKGTDGAKVKGFFLNIATSAGLAKNKIRVRLQNKAGQTVLDKIFDAPIEVRQ